MNVTTDCYGSIDIENIGFTLEQNGSLFDDPKCMVFADPPFVEEVILEKVEIGLVRIVRREELSVGWNADCRLRDIFDDSFAGADDCTIVEALYR
jgi:hypothetical protein